MDGWNSGFTLAPLYSELRRILGKRRLRDVVDADVMVMR
jgi:hypothetical protein